MSETDQGQRTGVLTGLLNGSDGTEKEEKKKRDTDLEGTYVLQAFILLILDLEGTYLLPAFILLIIDLEGTYVLPSVTLLILDLEGMCCQHLH